MFNLIDFAKVKRRIPNYKFKKGNMEYNFVFIFILMTVQNDIDCTSHPYHVSLK